MSTIVIMPGGFHPFHAGHMSLYNAARKAFPQADVYVAATNSQEERPFPFAIKEKLAKVAGVQPGHFIQVKSPFQAKEITQNYNPEQDVLIFVRSEKDRNESPKPGGTKKDGTPAYFQPYDADNLESFNKHAYFAYLPTVKFGPGITSATEIRKAWPTLDDRRKTAMVMSLYPATQKNPKLAANVVKMLDIGMGGQVAEAIDDKHRLSKGKPTSDEVRRKYFDKAMASVLGGQGTDSEKNKAASRYFKIKQITDPVSEGSNGEYDDEAGMAETNLHTIARAAQGLLDTIDDQENLPEWVQEKIAKVQGMMVASWDYLKSQEEQGIDPRQEVSEGSDGWIGNPTKWKEAVHSAHGPDVTFKNYSHPGQPGKRSVHAWDANNKIVGVYQRHNKMGMVQPNTQGVAEANDPWGPQGNFAGDTPVNLGGATVKKIQSGDIVSYFGEKARVIEVNYAQNYARINANMKTLNVKLSDLKGVSRDMKEGMPIVVAQAPIDVRNPKKAQQPQRYMGDIVPPTKPPSTEKRGVKGRPGQRPMPVTSNSTKSDDYVDEK